VVTEADLAVKEEVRRVLPAGRPEDAFLGEEAGESGRGRRRWILDGIDGTLVFVRGDERCAFAVDVAEGRGAAMASRRGVARGGAELRAVVPDRDRGRGCSGVRGQAHPAIGTAVFYQGSGGVQGLRAWLRPAAPWPSPSMRRSTRRGEWPGSPLIAVIRCWERHGTRGVGNVECPYSMDEVRCSVRSRGPSNTGTYPGARSSSQMQPYDPWMFDSGSS
jgi:hypothetical protein